MTDGSTDRIGDRLDHPERVPAEFQHLIPDDKARVEWILSHPVSGRVLDVGCSDGAISRRIAHKWQVTVDAQDKEHWDIREFRDSPPYDVIFCTEVLEHLFPHESQIALAHLWAVLKPGGKLIVTVPNRLSERGDGRDRWAWPDHKQYFQPSALWALLSRQFTMAQVRPIVGGIWLGAVCTK